MKLVINKDYDVVEENDDDMETPGESLSEAELFALTKEMRRERREKNLLHEKSKRKKRRFDDDFDED